MINQQSQENPRHFWVGQTKLRTEINQLYRSWGEFVQVNWYLAKTILPKVWDLLAPPPPENLCSNMVANSKQPVLDGPDNPGSFDIEALSRKYAEEKQRRDRPDGLAQNVELEDSDKFAYLAEDPFVDHDALNAAPPAIEDGQEVQVIILGAGFGGLLFAARLIEAGIAAEGIRIVDIAGGFGGTWYWYARSLPVNLQ